VLGELEKSEDGSQLSAAALKLLSHTQGELRAQDVSLLNRYVTNLCYAQDYPAAAEPPSLAIELARVTWRVRYLEV